ncbi:MAG: branched-chain amino acid transport system ATP-binding protein [Saprospiraceae bacterium]|jgi:branched-chain amino acid transport system ATP-binding protein
MLEINHLNKAFGGIRATDDLSLRVREGEIHAVIGPNGAGKTTFIKQLSGELRPDSGEMLFDGQNLGRVRPHKRAQLGLARSFQITSLILPMTVLENVMLAAQALSGHSFKFWAPVIEETQLRETASKYLKAVGLKNKAASIAGEIAYGEQRQLEIAMALALQPKLMLLDEPMAGMSKEETGNMIALLQGLKGTTTILLVEHDMDAVFALADTTSVMVNGHIIATGNTQEIRNNPEVEKAYLGESSSHQPSSLA